MSFRINTNVASLQSRDNVLCTPHLGYAERGSYEGMYATAVEQLLAFAAGRPVSTNSAASFADGMAVRIPSADAVAIINRGAERIVTVSEDEIAGAMRMIYRCTHNLAEGAGAAAVAAIVQERGQLQGQRVAAILTGGNIDMPKFATVLSGGTPGV